MNNYFQKMTASTIRKQLLELCNDGTPWINPTVGTFMQKKLPEELIKQDPFLKHVCENYLIDEFNISVHIFMLKPWSHYKLHTDLYRSVSINMLVNDYSDSISYFQTSEFQKAQCSIMELEYEPDYYYLFNNKIPHAMINRGEERYLLSLSLKGDFETMKANLRDYFFL